MMIFKCALLCFILGVHAYYVDRVVGIGSSELNIVNSVVDPIGNILMGEYSSAASINVYGIDGSVQTIITPPGSGTRAFVVKFFNNGTMWWYYTLSGGAKLASIGGNALGSTICYGAAKKLMEIYTASGFIVRTMNPTTSNGDVFVISWSNNGSFQWLAQSKCSGFCGFGAASVAANGEIALSVQSNASSFVMAGSNNVQISRTSDLSRASMFSIKLNRNGTLAWVASMINMKVFDLVPQAAAVSSFNGRIAVSGNTICDGIMVIYDGSDQYVTTATMYYMDQNCSFVLVYDQLGNYLNSIFMYRSGASMGIAGLTFDSQSNVYVKCSEGTSQLDILGVDGTGTQGIFTLELQSFVAKFSSTGAFKWLNQFSSPGLAINGLNDIWLNSAGLLGFSIGSQGGNILIKDSSNTTYFVSPMTQSNGRALVLINSSGLVQNSSITPMFMASQMSAAASGFESSGAAFFSGYLPTTDTVLFGDSNSQRCLSRAFSDSKAAFIVRYLPGTRDSCISTTSTRPTTTTTTTTTITTTSTTSTPTVQTTKTSTTTTTTTTTSTASTSATTPTITSVTTTSSAAVMTSISSADFTTTGLSSQQADFTSTVSTISSSQWLSGLDSFFTSQSSPVSWLSLSLGCLNSTSASSYVASYSSSISDISASNGSVAVVVASTILSSSGPSVISSISDTQILIQFSAGRIYGLNTASNFNEATSTTGLGSIGSQAGASSFSLNTIIASVSLTFAVCLIVAIWCFLRRYRRNRKTNMRFIKEIYSSTASSTHAEPHEGTNITLGPSSMINATTMMNTSMEIAVPAFLQLEQGVNFRRIDNKILSRGSQGIVALVEVFYVSQNHWLSNKGIRNFVGKFSTQDISYEVFMQEVALLWKFHQSDYVAKLAAFDHQSKVLIMSLYDLGALSRLIDGEMAAAFSFNMVIQLCHDAVSGIDVLHSSFVVHNDVKSANYLMEQRDGKLRLCLTDFGVCTIVDSSRAVSGIKWNTINGATVCYAAPEVLAKQTMPIELWYKRDIYSAAVVMNEILTRTQAWPEVHSEVVISNVIQGMRPSSENLFRGQPGCENLTQIINDAWSQDPALRPKAADLVRVLNELMQFQ